MITHADKMTVLGGALLRAVGWADGAVHVQRDPLRRLAPVKVVDPIS